MSVFNWTMVPQVGDWWGDKPAEIVGPNGRTIATLVMTENPADANAVAAKMAAAPEMLEALRQVKAQCQEFLPLGLDQQICDALNKAEGRL
ncbi:MAG TPA: hypothetical protein VNS12_13350 [Pelagibacterium sp.]|uniref:hypothetical protein n=1 Tax=Pelagibacterium sp. TaxID=1967288 RepID=UPI002B9DBD53|nr:hypothetical protein [Pelagibacterium sp.]HWJ89048.1 hypothetical protein [Pelagibacterium sp.]